MINSKLNKKKTSLYSIIKYTFLILLIIFFIFFLSIVYQSNLLTNRFVDYLEKFSINYEYSLKTVNINKLKNINISEVEKYFINYIDKSIFLVPVHEISNILLQNKWINKITVKSDYKNTIYVTITESVPIGIYYDDYNYYLFDINGSIIDSVDLKVNSNIDLIIFSGENSLPNANLLLKLIPLSLQSEIVEAIYINIRRWDIKLKNNIRLKLSENNIVESFNKYDKIYKSISNKDLKEIKSLDLRIPNKAILKFKDLNND